MTGSTSKQQPAFIDAIRCAYNQKGKSVVLVTGNTNDLYWSEGGQGYRPLEQALYQAFSGAFTMMRFDHSTGVDFYTIDDRRAVEGICQRHDEAVSRKEKRLGDVGHMIDGSRHEPLPALVLARDIADAVTTVRRPNPSGEKPLCVIVQYSGSLFPAGGLGQLSELDRQRLITFMNWISDPTFQRSGNMVILVADTRAEVNSRILGLPTSDHFEIDLPDELARREFTAHFTETCTLEFELGKDAPEKNVSFFATDSAGLRLAAVQDLLEVAHRSGEPVTRKGILVETASEMKALLGKIVEIKKPEHGIAAIIGYSTTTEILSGIFRDAEDPETASAALLITGANGVGKSYQLEAHTRDSNRIVLRLNLRSKWFGETDQFFEKLRMALRIFGKVLIVFDEADAALGKLSGQGHETENRLRGALFEMMADPTFRGKVLWALMTARPHNLAADVKSRTSEMVPVFDLEGEERRAFVGALLARKGVEVDEEELEKILEVTAHYSNRDYDNLARKAKARKQLPSAVLEFWSASSAIVLERRFQTLQAALHCSYPVLLSDELKAMLAGNAAAIYKELAELRFALAS